MVPSDSQRIMATLSRKILVWPIAPCYGRTANIKGSLRLSASRVAKFIGVGSGILHQVKPKMTDQAAEAA